MNPETATERFAGRTPGDWICDDRHIHPSGGRLVYPYGQEPETDVIVMVDTDCHKNGLLNETDLANLRLISQAPALLRERDQLREALEVILPMAKGYATTHPVGNNRGMVDYAIAALAACGGKEASV